MRHAPLDIFTPSCLDMHGEYILTTGKTLEMENAVILDDNSNRQPSKVNSLQDTGSKQQMDRG
jgi:hypothetical protein